MVPARSSNGRPGNATPLYPTDRKTSPTGSTSVSPVATARMPPLPSSTSELRTTRMPSTRSVPRISTGEVRNLSTMRRGRPSWGTGGEFPEGREVLLGGAIVGGCELGGAQRVELEVARVHDHVGVGQLAELRSSGLVNAACTGPRRPRT